MSRAATHGEETRGEVVVQRICGKEELEEKCLEYGHKQTNKKKKTNKLTNKY